DPNVLIDSRVDPKRGYTALQYDRYVNTLYLRFQKSTSDKQSFTHFGITLERDNHSFLYYDIGENDASTTSWLRCQQFVRELAVINPYLVVFSIGINDAHVPDFSAERFQQNYAELIERVQQAAPGAAILLLSNTDSYVKRKAPNKNGAA